jgi:RNase P protein component
MHPLFLINREHKQRRKPYTHPNARASAHHPTAIIGYPVSKNRQRNAMQRNAAAKAIPLLSPKKD